MEIQGKDLQQLSKEPGGHRIQRVPPTERRGRVHTSTVTVAVMNEGPIESSIELRKDDLKIEWYSGSGAGGQHRNKHQNSCRLTYIPTGDVVTAQCRSRKNSFDQAYTELAERITKQERNQEFEKRSEERRLQVGTGMRGDKVRTYRFQDDQVKDHRSGKTAVLSNVLAGRFDLLW